MVQSIIVIVAIGLLIGMSIGANKRFQNHAKLPMQWAPDGSVNLDASRTFALAFIPFLMSCILIVVCAMTLFLKPKPGQEGLKIPMILILSLINLSIFGFYLWLIEKHVRKNNF